MAIRTNRATSSEGHSVERERAMSKSHLVADTFHTLFGRIVESAAIDFVQSEHPGYSDRPPVQVNKRLMIGPSTIFRRSTLVAVRWLQQEDQQQMLLI